MAGIVTSHAQDRKLPPITFQQNSTEFADANRTFNENDVYSDTLRDAYILETLASILLKHQNLRIQISGHSAVNEDSTLAVQRAMVVQQYLINSGVNASRLVVKGYGARMPVIPTDIVMGLPTKEEKFFALQKNRRVEITVISNQLEE